MHICPVSSGNNSFYNFPPSFCSLPFFFRKRTKNKSPYPVLGTYRMPSAVILLSIKKKLRQQKNFGALATLSFWASPNVALKLNPHIRSEKHNSDLTVSLGCTSLHPNPALRLDFRYAQNVICNCLRQWRRHR